jgi:hypothetical protein
MGAVVTPYGPGGFNYAGQYTQRLAWGGPSKNERITADRKKDVKRWREKAKRCKYRTYDASRIRGRGTRGHAMCAETVCVHRCMMRMCSQVKEMLKR